MAKRGLQYVEGAADLKVITSVGIDMDNLEFKLDPASKLDLLYSIPKAALVIVLVEVTTGNAVWVGMASGDIQENASDKAVRKRLDYTITQLVDLIP